MEASRGRAVDSPRRRVAAAPWIVRGDEPRLRRGRSQVLPQVRPLVDAARRPVHAGRHRESPFASRDQRLDRLVRRRRRGGRRLRAVGEKGKQGTTAGARMPEHAGRGGREARLQGVVDLHVRVSEQGRQSRRRGEDRLHVPLRLRGLGPEAVGRRGGAVVVARRGRGRRVVGRRVACERRGRRRAVRRRPQDLGFADGAHRQGRRAGRIRL